MFDTLTTATRPTVKGTADRLTGLSLRWQICVFTCLAISASLVAMGWVAFTQASTLLTAMTLNELAVETNAAVSRIEQILDDSRIDLLQTPQFPPVPGIVRCADNNGMDPLQQGSDTQIWIERLETIVSAQMRQRPERLWTALIDAEGRQIMRVDRRDGLPVLASASTADFSTDSFVKTALKQSVEKVATSNMERSAEGVVVRLGTSYFDPQGKVRGVFVIALEGTAVLAAGVSKVKRGEVDVVDDAGNYLFCETSPEYAFSKRRYSQNKPVRAALLSNPHSPDIYRELIDGRQRPDGTSLIAGYQKLYYAVGDDSRFWAIAPDIPADEAMQPVSLLARRFWLLGGFIIIVAAGLTYVASRGLTAALTTVTETANEIASGNLDAELPPLRPIGEVQTLAESVRAMTASLRELIHSSREQQKRTSAILNSTVDGILTINEQGEIQTANEAALRLFGTNSMELIGSSAGRFVPALTSDESRFDKTQLSEGEVRQLNGESEVTGRTADGTNIPLALRVTEMEHSGERLFIATLQDITERRRVEMEKQRILEAIGSAVKRLAASSVEILVQTKQQAAATQQQAASVAETTATVKEITETAEQSTQRAEEVASSARRANDVSRSGREAVDETIEAMRHVQEQTESTAHNILVLAERAQMIGNIIATVSEIADQTNLLALNAAIEASRAGEHGRGFAVVATEVKTLAEQSRKATTQVRQILSEVQQATNTAVISTEQGTKSVIAAQQVVGRASQTISDLTKTISEAASSAQQIVASAGQQATGMKQIRDAMSHIDDSTRLALSATRQAEEAARDLSMLGHELRTLTEQSGVEQGAEHG
ncbi:MAG: methyl-accepting chemotaxis protein [Planctomycetota bacterium]|nr:methyl-accepting chemotaxis protein [Planctomycetota bacterium]